MDSFPTLRGAVWGMRRPACCPASIMRRLLTGRGAAAPRAAGLTGGGAGGGRGAAGVGSSSSSRLLQGRPLASAATPKLTEWMSFEKQAPASGGAGKQQGATAQAKAAEAGTRRTGAIALKVGMMGVYDKWGQRHPCTILALDQNVAMQVKKEATDGYDAVQLGAGTKKAKRVSQPERGHHDRWLDGNTGPDAPAKRQLWEFRVTPNALPAPGTPILAQHFVPGQKIDICGVSKGKGFTGVMKRWNFAGQGASHGVSITHRSLGSTGQNTSPGRVFKGKKMPGQLGGERVTVQGLWLYKIDTEKNLLYVRGHVPGPKGTYVRVTDAVKGAHFPAPPPVPTFVPEAGVSYPREITAPLPEVDPLVPPEGSEDE